jgi:hypothetical protein
MMTAKKRADLCDELIALAREVKGIQQKEWENYPEREREAAECSLVCARNFMKEIFGND